MTHLGSSDLNVKDISFINDIKSMAVIGPSIKRDFFFLRNHQANFKGELYAIHPNIKEIPNFPKNNIFSSILDVPGKVDFAFIAVPPSQVLDIIDDCVAKGVKLITLFTSEFSDSGTKDGIKLEKDLLKHAQNKVRILGPNGLGLFYPKLRITWRPKFPIIPGNIGFIAQSGGICNIAIYSALKIGINYSKVFSFGNGADLDLVDLLYFLSNDDETDIILCYIEGIKEGRSKDLQKVLEQNKKPLAILKGGQTKTGSIAAKTHTASVSGNNRIWEALFKQYNIIEVDTLEQLIHVAFLIDCHGVFELENLAVFSLSGGYGVILVDLIEQYGMKVPPFSAEIQKQLATKFFMPGTSSRNPLDLAAQFFVGNTVQEIIDLALSDKNIDGLILDIPGFYISLPPRLRVGASREGNSSFENTVIKSLSLGHEHKKPVIPIIQHLTRSDSRTNFFNHLIEKKIPVFGDPLEVIPLLPKISNYKRRLNEH